MGLCGSFRCGCGVMTDGTISISGSGEPGDPYVLSASASAAARFTRAAAQTVGAGATVDVSWTAETIDSAGWGTPTTTTLTCPVTGFYVIGWNVVKVGGSGIFGIRPVKLEINGTDVDSLFHRVDSLAVYLTLGDTLVLTVAEGGTLNSMDFTATLSIR